MIAATSIAGEVKRPFDLSLSFPPGAVRGKNCPVSRQRWCQSDVEVTQFLVRVVIVFAVFVVVGGGWWVVLVLRGIAVWFISSYKSSHISPTSHYLPSTAGICDR